MGWPFANVDPFPAADEDNLYQSEHVKDLYLSSLCAIERTAYSYPFFVSRFTVPVR
jgi:putative glutathione S-transferase